MNRSCNQIKFWIAGIISFLMISFSQYTHAVQDNQVGPELSTTSAFPDSTHKYLWDFVSSRWNLSSKTITTLRSENIIETVAQSYLHEQAAWINQNKLINIYNDNNLPEITEEYTWSDEFKRWDNLSKSMFYYDSISRITENVILKWNILKQDWVNYIRYRYSYSDYSDWSEMLMNSWDTENSKWINYYKHLHNFTGTNATELIILDWDKVNNVWMNYKRHTYDYINDSLLNSKQIFNWSTGNEIWNCFRKYHYNYDSRKNLTQEDIYLCLVDTMAYAEMKYDYDEFDRKLQLTDKRWDKTNMIWNNYLKDVYYYGEPTGIDWNNNIITVSPNPASDFIILKIARSDGMEIPNINIRIFDLLGLMRINISAYTPQNAEEIRIDISSLPKGMYFIHAGNKVLKFIKN
jgi:hypothetical protein